jgi:hypothetical protein
MIRFYETLGDVTKAMNCGKMPDLDTAMAMKEDAVRMVEAEEVHARENVSTPGVPPSLDRVCFGHCPLLSLLHLFLF